MVAPGDSNDEIWSGDRLGRQAEAVALERFLDSETAYMKAQGNEHAFVLALDAPYGEGKTWFLDRFARQLELNHPVARVDAWADDTNSEPLVALMASVEDALKPFLGKRQLKDRLVRAKASILPVIGKGAISFGSRFATKHFGDKFLEETAELIGTPLDEKALREGGTGTAEALQKSVDALIDRAAEKMLSDYRERKKSTEFFKSQLSTLVQDLSSSGKYPPVYVVLDELDRCRPSYALNMLEQIKHIFDVPGLVFVIALHGDQLEKSINAVYGAEFDSKAYLQRFFTRRYRLQRPSVADLTRELFLNIGTKDGTFSYPPLGPDGNTINDPALLAGQFLAYWRVSPRRVHAVMDCLRLFVSEWNHPIAIELPVVLNLIVGWLHGVHPLRLEEISETGPALSFKFAQADRHHSATAHEHISANQLIAIYRSMWGTSLPDGSGAESGGARGYVSYRYREEFAKLHSNAWTGEPPHSVWQEYPARIEIVGRFAQNYEGKQRG